MLPTLNFCLHRPWLYVLFILVAAVAHYRVNLPSQDSATVEVCQSCKRFRCRTLNIGNSRAFTVLHILAGVPKGTFPSFVMGMTIDLTFLKCYAQTDDPVECRPQSEDYLECLHRPKEVWCLVLCCYQRLHSVINPRLPVRKLFKPSSFARLKPVPRKDRRLRTCWQMAPSWD